MPFSLIASPTRTLDVGRNMLPSPGYRDDVVDGRRLGMRDTPSAVGHFAANAAPPSVTLEDVKRVNLLATAADLVPPSVEFLLVVPPG